MRRRSKIKSKKPLKFPVEPLATEIPLLTAEECAKIFPLVETWRPFWQPYGSDPNYPYYYVVPTALYFRTRQQRVRDYVHEIGDLNPRLDRDFGWIYERIVDAVARTTGVPTVLCEHAARPGFHVYLSSMPNDGRAHTDHQYEALAWPVREEWDFSRALTLTLAIEIPKDGAGLFVWPSAGERQKISYRAGSLYIFDSHLHHQVAASPGCGNGQRRVTLQSHAIYHRSNRWEIYW